MKTFINNVICVAMIIAIILCLPILLIAGTATLIFDSLISDDDNDNNEE